MSPHVSALYVYPVKSCGGISLERAEVGVRGIQHDREFMLVTPGGVFLTQREHPRLALIQPSVTAEQLELCAPGMPTFTLDSRTATDRMRVKIWRDSVEAVDQGKQVGDWLSTYLGAPCRLVRMPEQAVRAVDPQYSRQPDDQVSLADGFPLLLISEESLADLNARLATPLPMNRFRPNIVVRDCGAAYAEDEWLDVQIGSLHCGVAKACARCIITTTDQATTQRGSEPLATLSRYRQVPRGVLFGQNLIHAGPGHVAVGDQLTIEAVTERVATLS